MADAARRQQEEWTAKLEEAQAARRSDLRRPSNARERWLQADLDALVAERERAEAAQAERPEIQTQTDPNFMRFDAREARILARVEEQHEARMKDVGFDGRGSQPGSGSPIREIGAYQARALNLEAQAEVTRHHMLAKITFLTLLRSLRRRQAHALLRWRRVTDNAFKQQLSTKALRHGMATLAVRIADVRKRRRLQQVAPRRDRTPERALRPPRRGPHARDAREQITQQLRQQVEQDKAAETKVLRGRIAELSRLLRQREQSLADLTESYDFARVLVDQKRCIASLRGLLHEHAARRHQDEVVAVLLAAGHGANNGAVSPDALAATVQQTHRQIERSMQIQQQSMQQQQQQLTMSGHMYDAAGNVMYPQPVQPGA